MWGKINIIQAYVLTYKYHFLISVEFAWVVF